MAFLSLKDFDPNYKTDFDNQDIYGYKVYSGHDEVGTIEDLLVEENGNFRYLVLNVGNWITGKKVLLPIGRARFDYKAQCVYVDSFSRAQVEDLPAYTTNSVDQEQEEKVRGVYRQASSTSAALNQDLKSYTYNQDPDLYNLSDRDHQNLKLYEERLIANKTRQKLGEVAVGKHVETQTQTISIPLMQERIVIERNTPATQEVTPLDYTAFKEGEVARIEIYGESADIQKESFVREEVKVKKVVDQETATSKEVIRREELDINSNNKALIDSANLSPKNKI